MTVYVGMNYETLVEFHKKLGEQLEAARERVNRKAGDSSGSIDGAIEVVMEQVGGGYAKEVIFSNDDMENRDDVGLGTVFVENV